VSFGANLIDEVHELVRAKRVWFYYSTPIWIQRHGSTSDAFAPVIFISEATTWPTNVGNFKHFECGDNVLADTARVWDRGIRTDPDPFVYTVTEVLCELTEDVAIDLWARFGSIDGKLNFNLGRSLQVKEQNHRAED